MIEIQHAPNQWSCLATSFAMCFNIPILELFKLLGHDGSEIIWPDLEEPLCHRGHHLQELIDAGIHLNYATMYVERENVLMHPTKDDFIIIQPKLTIESYFDRFPGVILGIFNKIRHAVAYEKGIIYNPNGQVSEYKRDFEILAYCPVIKLPIEI